MGQRWPAAGSGILSVALCVWDLLKEVAIFFITSTIVWTQVKQQGGNTALPNLIENWIKDLLSMAPPIRTRSSFLQSFPSGNSYKPLTHICQREERMKTTITEK